MLIDGYSPAFVPNRTTRPDVSELYDLAQRQQEASVRQQQPEQISDAVKTETSTAVMQLTNESAALQQYQQRQALEQQNLPHHINKALSSYTQTSNLGQELQPEASQVLGLDLYA